MMPLNGIATLGFNLQNQSAGFVMKLETFQPPVHSSELLFCLFIFWNLFECDLADLICTWTKLHKIF